VQEMYYCDEIDPVTGTVQKVPKGIQWINRSYVMDAVGEGGGYCTLEDPFEIARCLTTAGGDGAHV
jgi:hypothetical protein